jgi:hypothetical protein
MPSFTDRLNALEDQAVGFLRSRAVLRLIFGVMVVSEVARKVWPATPWLATATEALVYAGAALGVVSPGLPRPLVQDDHAKA